MRAKLDTLNHCAVPFLSCAAVNLSWYDTTVHSKMIGHCSALFLKAIINLCLGGLTFLEV